MDTVGDELKIATGGKSRVLGISLKDRAAILLSGHSADAAYWYDSKTGCFVSSTYYFPKLPAWVADFNLKATERFKGAAWAGGKLPGDERINSAIMASVFGNELLESFAERAITAEGLGKNIVTDLLTVSFSSNHYVGHNFGPESAEARDITIETDQVLEKLFRFVDAYVGMKNVLVVLASDYGVAPTPEANLARGRNSPPPGRPMTLPSRAITLPR